MLSSAKSRLPDRVGQRGTELRGITAATVGERHNIGRSRAEAVAAGNYRKAHI